MVEGSSTLNALGSIAETKCNINQMRTTPEVATMIELHRRIQQVTQGTFTSNPSELFAIQSAVQKVFPECMELKLLRTYQQS